MMAGHDVLLAAFLVQAEFNQPEPFGSQVLDPHLQRRADPGEAIGEGGN